MSTPPATARPAPTDELALGTEWAALECICTGRAEANPDHLAWLLTREDLDWGELLEQGLRHQILPMVALHALEASERSAVAIPGRVAHHLFQVLLLNRWQLQVYLREALRIVEALESAGVPSVATKGITFEPTIYAGRGVRVLKDIDFMISAKDRERAAEVLRGLGYVPGVYDRPSGSIVPHPRRMQMVYAMSPDHLPRHARLSDDPCVPYLYVDVANSLTWTRSPYRVSHEQALRRPVRMPVTGLEPATLPTFGADFQFLFTVLHLFREAWFEQWLEWEMDVSLMKFGDVIRLFNAHRSELRHLAGQLEELGVVTPVAWVLEHTDRTFGTAMVDTLGLGGRVSEDELAGAQPSGGGPRRWEGTMRERLQAKDRRRLFLRAQVDVGPLT